MFQSLEMRSSAVRLRGRFPFQSSLQALLLRSPFDIAPTSTTTVASPQFLRSRHSIRYVDRTTALVEVDSTFRPFSRSTVLP